MSKIQGISHQFGAKACACNSSTWEAEAGRAPPFGAFLSYTEIKTSMQESFIWKRMVFAQRLHSLLCNFLIMSVGMYA